MSRVIAIAIAAMFAFAAHAGPAVSPSTSFPMLGMTFKSPASNGWELRGQQPDWTIVGLKGPAVNETTILQARVGGGAKGTRDEELFNQLFEFVLNHPGGNRFVKLHAERRTVTFKGARCLNYYTIHQDQKMSRSEQ